MESIKYIGEVGCRGNTISPTGIPAPYIHSIQIPNRVLILEPKEIGNLYRLDNDEHERAALRSKCLCFRGDIYRPDTLKDVPQLHALILQNVLNDPCYQYQKDWVGFVNFLENKILRGGIVIIVDSITGFSRLENKYSKIVGYHGKHRLLLNEMNYDEIVKYDEEHKQKVIDMLKEKGLVDKEFQEGLNTILHSSRWLVFQKP